jgi:NADPH:quinone reductase
VIAAYATRDPGPDFDFWPMLCANLTICLLGSDDFSREAKQQAAADLTRCRARTRASHPNR